MQLGLLNVSTGTYTSVQKESKSQTNTMEVAML